jgi:VPS62-like protein
MTEPSRTSPPRESQLREIAETFAPVVWLHKDDEYRPSSVDWYLARASLEYNNKRTIIEEGKITGAALISQTVESDHSDFAKAPYNRNQKFNLKIKNEPSIMKGDLNTARCYVHIRPNSGNLDIQYWFFYPYNGALAGSGAHEADWEHITIRFRTSNPQDKNDIEQVYFSRHSSTIWIKNENRKIEFEDKRPVIFSARHSHANYSTPEQHGGLGFTDKANRDVRWETWTQGGGLDFLEDNPANELRHLWNRFNGNWGGSKSMVSTPGIRGKHGWDAD